MGVPDFIFSVTCGFLHVCQGRDSPFTLPMFLFGHQSYTQSSQDGHNLWAPFCSYPCNNMRATVMAQHFYWEVLPLKFYPGFRILLHGSTQLLFFHKSQFSILIVFKTETWNLVIASELGDPMTSNIIVCAAVHQVPQLNYWSVTGLSMGCMFVFTVSQFHIPCAFKGGTCTVEKCSVRRFITLHAYVLTELGVAKAQHYAAVLKSPNADVNYCILVGSISVEFSSMASGCAQTLVQTQCIGSNSSNITTRRRDAVQFMAIAATTWLMDTAGCQLIYFVGQASSCGEIAYLQLLQCQVEHLHGFSPAASIPSYVTPALLMMFSISATNTTITLREFLLSSQALSSIKLEMQYYYDHAAISGAAAPNQSVAVDFFSSLTFTAMSLWPMGKAFYSRRLCTKCDAPSSVHIYSISAGEQLKFYSMLLDMVKTIVVYLWTCCDRLGFIVAVLNSPGSSSLLYTNMLQHMDAIAVWSYQQLLHFQFDWVYEAMVRINKKSLVVHKAVFAQNIYIAPILILFKVVVFYPFLELHIARPELYLVQYVYMWLTLPYHWGKLPCRPLSSN